MTYVKLDDGILGRIMGIGGGAPTMTTKKEEKDDDTDDSPSSSSTLSSRSLAVQKAQYLVQRLRRRNLYSLVDEYIVYPDAIKAVPELTEAEILKFVGRDLTGLNATVSFYFDIAVRIMPNGRVCNPISQLSCVCV